MDKQHGPAVDHRELYSICSDRSFPGGAVIKTLRLHCSGHRFNCWLGRELSFCMTHSVAKKKINERNFFLRGMLGHRRMTG